MTMRRRVSLTGIWQNLFPAASPRGLKHIDMSAQQLDTVVQYQLQLRHPQYLDAHSLVFAGIVSNGIRAEHAHKLLVKHQYILAAPVGSADVEHPAMTVDTNIIDRSFARNLPTLSMLAHRKLVCLLFFWEEEVNRWRMLLHDESIIRDALATATGPTVQDLTIALEAVEIKKMLLPSQRAEGTSTVIPPRPEPLPTYSATPVA